MIARATLALMLAGPALMGSLVVPTHPAAAQTRKPSVLPSGTEARDRAASSRRSRGMAAQANRSVRRVLSAPPARIDDGLAYDTPRDAQGRPFPDHAAETGPGAIQTGAIQTGTIQTGTASWYGGSEWQGHRMSNGDRYEQDRLTAAHATLPMGTKVLVSLVDSRRSVIVTVTDRPGTRTRIIDLSRGAAAALGIMDRGLAKVTLTPL